MVLFNKKRILFFCVAFLFCNLNVLLFADEKNSFSFVDTICQGLAENQNTTGTFTQTKVISQSGRKLKSTGTFIISSYGIMWKTEKPFANTLIITEDKMIQTTASGNKSILDGSENQIFKSISSVLQSIFMGNTQKLYENFEISVKNERAENWVIELVPKDANINSVMKTFTLSGEIQNNRTVLNSLEILEQSDNIIKYEFSNHQYPQDLTENEKNSFTDN